MNLGKEYAVWTHFAEMTGEGLEAVKVELTALNLKK